MNARFHLTTACFAGLICAPVFAQTAAETPIDLSHVTVLGNSAQAEDAIGSAHTLDRDDLDELDYSDVMRALRAVPGVYVQDEDGYGLRPNIGIRGSGLDRSSRIALLEDGVLIAPAPYAAPSAYYFPTQRRMYALEVLKGPAAVVIGPRTTGGALNMLSTPIPREAMFETDLRIGDNNSADLVARAGNSSERFGWMLETVQQQTDGFKTVQAPISVDTGYELHDYVAKFRIASDASADTQQSLALKISRTDQTANETYLGLTDADFAADPYARYAASQLDQLNSDHEQFQLTYGIDFMSSLNAQLTAYRNTFSRNWFKLGSVNGTGISSILANPQTYAAELAIIQGGDSAADALVNRNNARSYDSHGVQARLSHSLSLGAADIDYTFGLRVHEDEEDRLQDDDSYQMLAGIMSLTSDGAPGSATNRLSTAKVNAAFIDTRIRLGAWQFTPGIRFEDITLTRFDFATSDPSRQAGATRVRENSITAVIPGFGIARDLAPGYRLIASVNKGFNPPAPGSSASEEESWNYEAGLRINKARSHFNAIAFFNDYDNLVGTVSASTGGNSMIGDQFDGGQVQVRGLELDGGFAIANLAGSQWSLPVSASYTWTQKAKFSNSFVSGYEPWGDVESGDTLPYIPEHQLQVTAGLSRDKFNMNLSAAYVGQARSVAGQGAIESGSGTDSFVVWDALASWQATAHLRGYVKVNNLLDREYAVARRPAGLRPGLPRTAYLGLNYQF